MNKEEGTVFSVTVGEHDYDIKSFTTEYEDGTAELRFSVSTLDGKEHTLTTRTNIDIVSAMKEVHGIDFYSEMFEVLKTEIIEEIKIYNRKLNNE